MYKSAEALLSRLDSLPTRQKNVLKEYYEDNSLNNSAYHTCENKLIQLINFAKYIKKPFDEITKQDIKEYLIKRQNEIKPSSLSIYKSILKNFFKWYYNTDDYPDCVRWIKTGYANSGNDFPEGVLTPEEVKLMINKAESVQRKGIISVLYDTAVRVGELVGIGQAVITLGDSGGWIVKTTDLTQIDVVNVKVGLPAEIVLDALKEESLSGTVTDIASVATRDLGEVTYAVEISLDDVADLPIRWGMTAEVFIDTES